MTVHIQKEKKGHTQIDQEILWIKEKQKGSEWHWIIQVALLKPHSMRLGFS